MKVETAFPAKSQSEKMPGQSPAKRHFYGDVYPVAQRAKETRVVIKVEPIKVSLGAVFIMKQALSA